MIIYQHPLLTPHNDNIFISIADKCGKELFTVRTMNVPSNCPPKLTSKILQYFFNHEFDRSNSLSQTNSTGFNTYDWSQYPIQNQINYNYKCNLAITSSNNDSKNYEILQYLIDLDQSATETKSASSSQNGLLTKITI
jgi:hypothetical protein